MLMLLHVVLVIICPTFTPKYDGSFPQNLNLKQNEISFELIAIHRLPLPKSPFLGIRASSFAGNKEARNSSGNGNGSVDE